MQTLISFIWKFLLNTKDEFLMYNVMTYLQNGNGSIGIQSKLKKYQVHHE